MEKWVKDKILMSINIEKEIERWGGKKGENPRKQLSMSAKLRTESSPGSLKMRTENSLLDLIIRRSPRAFHMRTFGEVKGVKVRLQRLLAWVTETCLLWTKESMPKFSSFLLSFFSNPCLLHTKLFPFSLLYPQQ